MPGRNEGTKNEERETNPTPGTWGERATRRPRGKVGKAVSDDKPRNGRRSPSKVWNRRLGLPFAPDEIEPLLQELHNEAHQFRERPLTADYRGVFIDATVVRVRDEKNTLVCAATPFWPSASLSKAKRKSSAITSTIAPNLSKPGRSSFSTSKTAA